MQAKFLQTKSTFSDLEIMGIWGQVSYEKYDQDEPTKSDETQNSENQTLTEPSIIASILISNEETL